MGQSNLLYVQVKDYIKNLIREMKPDSKLPSRSAICNKLGVARITVDRAISELIGEGYLYTQNGSGTYVAVSSPLSAFSSQGSSIPSWGVVVPHTGTFMFPQLIKGISAVTSQYGINLILCDTNDNYLQEEKYISSLITSRVSGAIIVPVSDENMIKASTYDALAKAGIPFIFCNRAIQGVKAHVIKSNEYHGSYLAVKHLLAHGYHSIAFVSQKCYSITEQRFSGYSAALNEQGLSVNPALVYMHDTLDEKAAAVAAAAAIQKNRLHPDAVFCFSDYLASFLIDELNRMGIQVPDDIALVSCDNSMLCDIMPKKLTSVDGSRYETGYEAALELVRMTGIDKNLPPSPYAVGDLTVLPQKLIIRESCGCIG